MENGWRKFSKVFVKFQNFFFLLRFKVLRTLANFCHNLHADLHGNPRLANYRICIGKQFVE